MKCKQNQPFDAYDIGIWGINKIPFIDIGIGCTSLMAWLKFDM